MDSPEQIGFNSYSCDRPIKMAHNAGTGVDGEYNVGTLYWCNNNIKNHLGTQRSKENFIKFVLVHELTHQVTQKNTTDNYYGAKKCFNGAKNTVPDTFDNTDCVAMVIADMVELERHCFQGNGVVHGGLFSISCGKTHHKCNAAVPYHAQTTEMLDPQEEAIQNIVLQDECASHQCGTGNVSISYDVNCGYTIGGEYYITHLHGEASSTYLDNPYHESGV